MIWNRGMNPKTNLEGTRPLSFIVSFTHLMAIFSCWSLNFLKMQWSGSCNFSPIPIELCALTPENRSSIPNISVICFHLSDVKMEPRYALSLFGYTVYMTNHVSINANLSYSTDCPLFTPFESRKFTEEKRVAVYTIPIQLNYLTTINPWKDLVRKFHFLLTVRKTWILLLAGIFMAYYTIFLNFFESAACFGISFPRTCCLQ